MNFVEKLKRRWNLRSTTQVVLVLVVFTLTGFTVLFIKEPLLELLNFGGDNGWEVSLLYYLFILPLYQIILLVYAFLLGQLKFFWAFEQTFCYSHFFAQ